jgi:hypothetical protein
MRTRTRTAVLFLGVAGAVATTAMGCELLVTFPASEIDGGPDGEIPETAPPADVGPRDTQSPDVKPDTAQDAGHDTGTDGKSEGAADVASDTPTDTTSKDAKEACVPESLAEACNTLCGAGSAVDNCGVSRDCTPNTCLSGHTCDETMKICSTCVANGDTVSSTSDCTGCCSTACSTSTTCCTPMSVAAACGTQCSGTASNGCGSGTVDCSTNTCSGTDVCNTTTMDCVQCLLDTDCMGGDFCDTTTDTCVACVPMNDDAESAADCAAACCSMTACTLGSTCD